MLENGYDYFGLAVGGVSVIAALVMLRRPKAKADPAYRTKYRTIAALSIALIFIVIAGQFVDVDKHPDSFVGMVFCVVVLLMLVVRGMGNRGGKSKRRDKR